MSPTSRIQLVLAAIVAVSATLLIVAASNLASSTFIAPKSRDMSHWPKPSSLS